MWTQTWNNILPSQYVTWSHIQHPVDMLLASSHLQLPTGGLLSYFLSISHLQLSTVYLVIPGLSEWFLRLLRLCKIIICTPILTLAGAFILSSHAMVDLSLWQMIWSWIFTDRTKQQNTFSNLILHYLAFPKFTDSAFQEAILQSKEIVDTPPHCGQRDQGTASIPQTHLKVTKHFDRLIRLFKLLYLLCSQVNINGPWHVIRDVDMALKSIFYLPSRSYKLSNDVVPMIGAVTPEMAYSIKPSVIWEHID